MSMPFWNGFAAGLAGVTASLLLLFAVGPFCSLGLPWLPAIESGAIVTSRPDDLRISVPRWVRIDETEIRAALAKGTYRRIVIEADRKVPFGALAPIFRAARDYRVPVALVSEPVAILEAKR